MTSRCSLRAVLLALLAGAPSLCAAEPPRVVEHVDLPRYMGLWYEVARTPNRFQRGCHASTAEYALRPDGDVSVVNSCAEGSPAGPRRSVRGKAWLVPGGGGAKLRVRFFWPFSGAYWIIDLGKDYEYAVVGHPTRKYLWILARTPTLDEAVYAGILERLRAQGYDPSRLERAVHPAPRTK